MDGINFNKILNVNKIRQDIPTFVMYVLTNLEDFGV